MARIERIVTVCDNCETEAGVEAHTLKVDRASWSIDACDRCWHDHYRTLLEPLMTGTTRARIGKGRRKRLEAV